ncbi:ankyrin repeat-containing domain protein [Corynascus similis CBS 632.67]
MGRTSAFNTEAKAVESAVEAEVDVVQTYDIVEKDTVPAPEPEAGASPQRRIDIILQWLQPTDFLSPGSEFMKHLHSYVPGTGRWARKSGSFHVWSCLDDVDDSDDGDDGDDGEVNEIAVKSRRRKYRCLLVRGIAGTGKSVFAANAVRMLQKAGDGRIVLFFFFRQIVDKNHTARYLVRDFAAQLLPHSPALVAALTALSQKHAVRGNELALVWPVLVETLRKDESLRGRVFCVVDALDEMDDSELECMMDELVALGNFEPPAARVMMTSRPLPQIDQPTRHRFVLRLLLNPAIQSPDVARYVDARMATLNPPLSTDKRELVRQIICKRANGLFLQARLMVDNLAEGLLDGRITPETLPNSLECLPRTLRDVYESMLREHARRSGVTREQQANILMCVTRASRPLRLIELGSLLARLLHVDLGQAKDIVRRGCGRLLELLEDETVSVIHHSFTEFLYDKSRKEDDDAFPVLEDSTSHAMLATLSLEYLDGCPHLDTTIYVPEGVDYNKYIVTDKEERRRAKIRTDTKVNQPLASYAVNNLFFHISKVPPGGTAATQLLAALDRYLVPGKPAFETLMFMKCNGPFSTSFNIFHLITAMYEGRLVPKYVLEHFADRHPTLVDSRDARGLTPLARAAREGYTVLVEVLLARGANPNSRGNDGLAPLHRATIQRRTDVAKLLLNAGVGPLVKTERVRRIYDRMSDRYVYYTEEEAERYTFTALGRAMRDQNELVKVFIPFIPPIEVNKYLHQADGFENVKAILEAGKVDVDCFRSGATKLFCAAQSRDPDVVKLLLEHGADPNKRCDPTLIKRHGIDIQMEVKHPHSERGPTPLHGFAGFYGTNYLYENDKDRAAKCLQVLIDAGADVNATMDDKESKDENVTPLHIVLGNSESDRRAWRGTISADEILPEILLSVGADPNAKTKKGNTPLHITNPEKPPLLDLLVKHGADIDAVNAAGRTPLLELIYQLPRRAPYEKLQPNVEVFERLQELGADTNIADDQGDTILHHIICGIASFTDSKFMPYIRRLLNAGADPNKKNKKGEPPLWKYLSDCCDDRSVDDAADEALLQMLIDAGMDLNARDNEGHTFLWELGKRRNTQINDIKKLIRLGADPRALAPDGRTLLHIAINRSDSPEWFRFLISAGVRTDTLTHDGGTMIHAVLRGSQDVYNTREMLQILVEEGVPPLARNTKGQSALHVANEVNLNIVLSVPMFKDLDVNEPDVDGLTPLHHFAGLEEMAVWELLCAGADPTGLTANRLSPLHVAASNGQGNVVGLLLAQYRERNVLETYINLLGDGSAPLHYACQAGSPEAVWTLLHNGADARLADKTGLTPLHVLSKVKPQAQSMSSGELDPLRSEIVRMLQLAGADVNAEVVVQTSDEATASKMTPLDMAVERQCWGVVRGLMAHGAEPRDNYKQSKMFMLATDKEQAAKEARKAQARAVEGQNSSMSSQSRVCRWRGRWAAFRGAKTPLEEGTQFIAGGQDILDATKRNGQRSGNSDNKVYGIDILYDVLHDGDYDTIKEYAELGGDMLEQKQNGDNTILHYIVQEGHVELLEHLGDKVTELEMQERVKEDGLSPETLLVTACKREQPSLHLIQLLVEKFGVDVDAKSGGQTALHILVGGANFWQVEALEYLISKGANIEARNIGGMTPLLAAFDGAWPARAWNEVTVRVLLRHGAHANATVVQTMETRTKNIGHSALEMSDKPGTTKLLLEHGVKVENCPGILTHAVRNWMDPGIIELLLDIGLDPNKLPLGNNSKSQGKTDLNLLYPLHEATRPPAAKISSDGFKLRQQAVLDVLLSRGADPYAFYPDGRFVFQAIVEERGDVKKLLPKISRGNCNLRGHHGRTLLVSACAPAISLGPDGYIDTLTRVSDDYNDTKWRLSVMVDVIGSLLAAGADALAVDDEGRTPLHWLCMLPEEFDEGSRDAFTALTRHCPAAIFMADKQGRTPLHLALATYSSGAQRSAFTVQHLLSVGADPVHSDPITGNSALHFIAPRLVGEAAAATEATALFRSLASMLDIDARNFAGETPVFTFASATWNVEEDPVDRVGSLEYSLAHDVAHAAVLESVFADPALGVDLVGATGARGRTLLHVIAGQDLTVWPCHSVAFKVQIKSLEDAFKKLLELGLDPRREDDELRTAIDTAVANDMTGIVALFAEKRTGIEEDGL